MRYIKMLGLAAVAAAALMAFVGASSASATVLCKTTPTVHTCPEGWAYPAGTAIHAVLKEGTKAVLSAGITDECSKSTVQGSTDNEGSASETVHGAISTLTFEECSCTTTEIKENGSLEIHFETTSTGAPAGTLTGSGTKSRVVCGGIECKYGTSATDIGTLDEPETSTSHAILTAEASLIKEGGSFLCASTAKWTAKYTVTSPVPLYVAAET
jgi:hypothetical protein